MEKILLTLLIASLFFLYKINYYLSKAEENSFETLVDKESLRSFKFENLHKKVFLAVVSLALSILFLTALIWFYEFNTIENNLKRIEKISKRVLVYTTDGRYGMAFKGLAK